MQIEYQKAAARFSGRPLAGHVFKRGFLLRELDPSLECQRFSIASHRKADIQPRDGVNLFLSTLSRLQYVINEFPFQRITFISVLFHSHTDVFALGIQLGIRESHAYGKRCAFTRIKYERPISNFYLDGGGVVQESSRRLLFNDRCFSSSKRRTRRGNQAKPLFHRQTYGWHVQ